MTGKGAPVERRRRCDPHRAGGGEGADGRLALVEVVAVGVDAEPALRRERLARKTTGLCGSHEACEIGPRDAQPEVAAREPPRKLQAAGGVHLDLVEPALHGVESQAVTVARHAAPDLERSARQLDSRSPGEERKVGTGGLDRQVERQEARRLSQSTGRPDRRALGAEIGVLDGEAVGAAEEPAVELELSGREAKSRQARQDRQIGSGGLDRQIQVGEARRFAEPSRRAHRRAAGAQLRRLDRKAVGAPQQAALELELPGRKAQARQARQARELREVGPAGAELEVRADEPRRRAELAGGLDRRRADARPDTVDSEAPGFASEVASELELSPWQRVRAEPRAHLRRVRSLGRQLEVEDFGVPQAVDDAAHRQGDSSQMAVAVDGDAVLGRRDAGVETERGGRNGMGDEPSERGGEIGSLHADLDVRPAEGERIAHPSVEIDLQVAQRRGQRLFEVVTGADRLEGPDPAGEAPRLGVEAAVAVEVDHPADRIEGGDDALDAERQRLGVRRRAIEQLEAADRGACDLQPRRRRAVSRRPWRQGELPVARPAAVPLENDAGVLELDVLHAHGARPERRELEVDPQAPGADHRRLGAPRGVRQRHVAGGERRRRREREVEPAGDRQLPPESLRRLALDRTAQPGWTELARGEHDRHERGDHNREPAKDLSAAIGHRFQDPASLCSNPLPGRGCPEVQWPPKAAARCHADRRMVTFERRQPTRPSPPAGRRFDRLSRKEQILMRRLMVLMLACALAAPVAGFADDREKEQKEVRKAAKNALSAVYKAAPSAKKAVQSAAGYAAFSNFGMKILFAGSGTGKGIAVDNKTKTTTYMKMFEVQAGLGFGVKRFSLVWVFETDEALKEFVDAGWEIGAQATAAAKSEDKGALIRVRSRSLPGSGSTRSPTRGSRSSSLRRAPSTTRTTI